MDRPTQQFHCLVTGSSGFIGSRLVKRLIARRDKVWGLDLLPDSNLESKNYHHTQLDLVSEEAENTITKLLSQNEIQIVIHLAGLIKVGEGEKQPDRYKQVNIGGTEVLLKAMKTTGVKKIIFASSAAVYKSPEIVTKDLSPRSITPQILAQHALKETDPLGPVSVYGKTKLMAEQLIQQYIESDGFKGVAFRFFNVGGGKEIHQPSVHLIPIIIDKLLAGEPVHIFGKDYPTSDGTCYRDYFHVNDLVKAIVLAMEKIDQVTEVNQKTSSPSQIVDPKQSNQLKRKPELKVYNLGQGMGFTVLQVFKQVSHLYHYKAGLKSSENGRLGSMVFDPRRGGDPPILLANCNKARIELGWTATKSLEEIIKDTLREMRKEKRSQSDERNNLH